jgi:glycine oxidase
MSRADVIVVGGGVVGCACAYFLAREGLSVSLLERDGLAAHASGAAAGMLAPICESSGAGPFFEFALQSLEMFPALMAELCDRSRVDPQYVSSGVLRVAGTREEARHLERQATRLRAYGLEWLPAAAAREREPQVMPDLHGALWSPKEGHVYSPLLTAAYARAAAQVGARIQCGVPVLGLRREGDRVAGVVTAGGELGAGHVVLCAGVWTRFCAEWLGVRLPLEPVRGQILALDAPQPALRSIVWDEHVYLVPKLNGSVVAGATEERAGFDCRTTARGVESLLAAAARLVPALGDASFRHSWAGLRPETPDQLPAIGPIPGVEGVTIAAGHFRNGVLLSPGTGRLVADWILTRERPLFARAFLPGRLMEAA